MRILSITAGAAGMYCGSCLRDNALAIELMARGHDVTLVPVYTPTLTDDRNVSRRDVLFGALAAGAMMPIRGALAKASQPATPVNFAVPPGACDCHVHVFGDPQKYPFFSGRTYSPETASVVELRQLLSALHLDRVVIVQQSPHERAVDDGDRRAGTISGLQCPSGDDARSEQVEEVHTNAVEPDNGRAGGRYRLPLDLDKQSFAWRQLAGRDDFVIFNFGSVESCVVEHKFSITLPSLRERKKRLFHQVVARLAQPINASFQYFQ